MFQLLLGVGCVNALAYNVVHYLMIQRTSAVTTTVLGEIKIVGLLLLSALLLGESPPPSLRVMHAAYFVACLWACWVARTVLTDIGRTAHAADTCGGGCVYAKHHPDMCESQDERQMPCSIMGVEV